MSIAVHAIAERAVAHGPIAPVKKSGSSRRKITAQRDATLTPEPR